MEMEDERLDDDDSVFTPVLLCAQGAGHTQGSSDSRSETLKYPLWLTWLSE